MGTMTLLNANIIRSCSWGFILAYIIIFSFWVITGANMFDGSERIIGGDFICFYAASYTLLSGDVLGIYDGKSLYEVEKRIYRQANISRANIISTGWYYPPTFLLFVAYLATLPYFLALFAWLAITMTGYIMVVRKIAPHPCTVVLTLAFPGTFQNFICGQNGFLSALLLGQGLLLLEQKPRLAGLILGLLVYKPHLAVLVVIALAAARKWSALIAACASAAAFIAVSIALYGMASWEAFYRTIPLAQYLLESGALPWHQMTTFFALARLLGVSVPLAYGLQAVFAVIAVISVAWVWYQRVFPLAYIVLTISIFLATPYAYQYDLTITGLSIAWYSWEGLKNGWLPYEKTVLLLAWFMPLLNSSIARFTNLQIIPIVLCVLLVLALRRQHILAKAAAVPESNLAAAT
jgi:hypothetical protein